MGSTHDIESAGGSDEKSPSSSENPMNKSDSISSQPANGIMSCVKKKLELIASWFDDEEPRNTLASYGVCLITGRKPCYPDWTIQDNYAVAEDIHLGQKMQVFVLLDGHGTYGHFVSEHCRENLPKLLSEADYNPAEAFKRMHNKLCKSRIETESSGTTCVVVIIEPGKRYTVSSLCRCKEVDLFADWISEPFFAYLPLFFL